MDHLDPGMRSRLQGHYDEIPFLSCTDVVLGERVILNNFINLYGCEIGDDTNIGAFVEIGKGVKIGKRCKIGCRAFIPPGVTIEDEVFIGPGVIFTNDKYPKATGDWRLAPTKVYMGASIGAGCIILPGLEIGADCLIGAGTVVTHDVPPETVLYNPRARRWGESL